MKQALALTLIASALSLPVAAHAQSFYVGGNIGSAKAKVNSTSQTADDSGAGFKVYGGYQLTPNFGAEVGYSKLGNTDASYKGVKGAHIKPHALYAAATATMPLSDQFSLFGKVGLSANRNKFEQPGGKLTDKYSKNGIMFGVGAAYNITPALALVAEYENYGKVQNNNLATVKADMFSAGLRYKF
ncbi:outer membrane beta-barrel protein [Janthinobacterium fluminis]|uniref:Outer membrane beta-barrel protein n=1 Tax=Janthinobacterium fluminis TaxID=2987524 RepID=A0ABT5K2V8_9BURK|nr:outer membrane beta-barrel protein [Janthinobacterium fluminis]MDC8759066.1 outer membrane beta-barrel protein [Janthinobacterium fluminis]